VSLQGKESRDCCKDSRLRHGRSKQRALLGSMFWPTRDDCCQAGGRLQEQAAAWYSRASLHQPKAWRRFDVLGRAGPGERGCADACPR